MTLAIAKTKDQLIEEIAKKTSELEVMQMHHDLAKKNGYFNEQIRISNDMEKLADSIAPLQNQLELMGDE